VRNFKPIQKTDDSMALTAAFLPDCLRFAIIHNVNMAGIENYSLIRLLAERRLIPSECHTHTKNQTYRAIGFFA